MKIKSTLAILFAVLSIASVSEAQRRQSTERPVREREARTERTRPGQEDRCTDCEKGEKSEKGKPKLDKKALLERFDRNGDGKLSPGEKEELGQFIRRLGEHRRKGDESGKREHPRRDQALERLDLNGDGKIDESEREAFRKLREDIRERRGGESDRPERRIRKSRRTEGQR